MLIRNSFKLAFASEGLFPCLLLKPLASGGGFNSDSAPSQPGPRCPPPCLSVLACCLLPGPELRGSPRRPQPREKNIQMGGNRRVFCFLLQERARLFLAPFSTNQIFFFLSFSKPCVWQASGRGANIRARILNTVAFLLGVSFVSLPLLGCLPCLRIADFLQTPLSSQRK